VESALLERFLDYLDFPSAGGLTAAILLKIEKECLFQNP
jgi:hypothetical protein